MKKTERVDDRLKAKALRKLQKYGMKVTITVNNYGGDLVVGVARRCDDGPLVNKAILVRGGMFDVSTVADLMFGCPRGDPPRFETKRQYYYH